MTQPGKPLICHICGKKPYTNSFPDREERASEKKAENVEDKSKKESAPAKALVNVTIG